MQPNRQSTEQDCKASSQDVSESRGCIGLQIEGVDARNIPGGPSSHPKEIDRCVTIWPVYSARGGTKLLRTVYYPGFVRMKNVEGTGLGIRASSNAIQTQTRPDQKNGHQQDPCLRFVCGYDLPHSPLSNMLATLLSSPVCCPSTCRRPRGPT